MPQVKHDILNHQRDKTTTMEFSANRSRSARTGEDDTQLGTGFHDCGVEVLIVPPKAGAHAACLDKRRSSPSRIARNLGEISRIRAGVEFLPFLR